MSQYYDAKETRSPEQREGELFNALPNYIAHAQSKSVAWGSLLSGIQAQDINSRKALAKLPVLRILSAGNVAGEGAKMALLSLREREGANLLLDEVRYVELSDRPDFNDKFVEQLGF